MTRGSSVADASSEGDLSGGESNSESLRGRHFARQQVEREPGAVMRKKTIRWAKIGTIMSLCLAMVLGLGFVIKLRSNMSTAPLSLGASSGLPDGPLEILLLGTDTRTGSNGRYGGAEFTAGEGHSDVMMLLQISEDREHVTVVSFPRDTLVPLPACTDPKSGKTYPAQNLAMLNYALSYGGPGCTVAAVNQLTGLSIDHFMMADFTAVKELSNVVGGVDVCLNSAVKDPKSGLDLPAGISSVKGDQALAYLRTRHGFADGGDRGRIRAQQAFMASLMRKVKGEGTLTDLGRSYRIGEAVTKNLTVDEGLSNIPTLLSVARRMSEAQLGNIAFVTLPTKPYAPDPNRLAVDEPKAQKLFSTLRGDGNLTDDHKKPSSSAPSKPSSSSASPRSTPSSTPTPSQTFGIARSQVPMTLVDGLNDGNRVREVLSLLSSIGYPSPTRASGKATKIPTSQILYQPGYEQAARDLANALKIDTTQLQSTVAVTGLQLVMGADFASGKTVSTGKKTVGDGLDGQTADQVTCQQGNPFG